MKAIIITLLAIIIAIVILVVGLAVVSQSEDIYAVAPTVQYQEILDEKEGSHLYYFYQPTCSHCMDLKPTIEEFYAKLEGTDQLDFTLIDMALPENSEGWYDWNSHYEKYGEGTDASLNPDYIGDPKEMKTIEDIQITGTPTLIYVKDGVVQNYEIGNTPIERLLTELEAEYNLN